MPDMPNQETNQDVKEILEDIPAAIFRYGNIVFLFIVLVFVLIAWFVKYPDVLQAGITITSSKPPVPIIANSSGELIDIRVSEESVVNEGDVLAIIESTTDHKDAFLLLKSIEEIKISEIEKLIQEERQWSENLNLGSINVDYADFLSRYYEYWRFKKYNPLDNQIVEETRKLNELDIYLQKLNKQATIFNSEIKLFKVDFDRDKKLFKEQVISQKQLEEKERQLLALRRENQSIQLEISQVKINVSDSRKLLADMSFQKEERNQSLRLALFDSYKQLQFVIRNWERNFVIKAPVDGKVSLFDYWSENQYVSRSDEIFTVIPSQDSKKIGKVLLPIRNSGKIEKGQKAIIKLDDFLFQEYGTLVGKVAKVSLVPRGNLYAVEIELPNGLLTSYGKALSFREEMRGSVEIITEELNLLERIFYDLRRRIDSKDVPSQQRLNESASIQFLDSEGNPKSTLMVEVARTKEEVQQGLMYRSALGNGQGMLFVRSNESQTSMWMKNTNVPLDIIFVNAAMDIVEIAQNAKPLSRKAINSKKPTMYVIEANAGFVQANQIMKAQKVAIIFN